VALVTLILLAYFLMPVEADVRPGNVYRALGVLLLLGLVAVGMTRMLRLQIQDEQRRAEGLVLGIMIVVVVFAFVFYTLEVHQPGEVAGLRTRLDALYFAVSTLSTIGYGDIHAVGQAARALVIVQVLFDFVFVAAAASLLAQHLRTAAEQRARTEKNKGAS